MRIFWNHGFDKIELSKHLQYDRKNILVDNHWVIIYGPVKILWISNRILMKEILFQANSNRSHGSHGVRLRPDSSS